jgi:DNA repair exonuclease SbcCD ATPase subunit
VVDEDVDESAMLSAVFLREALEEERNRQAASASQLGGEIAQLEASISKLTEERVAAAHREEEARNATLVSKNEEVEVQKRLSEALAEKGEREAKLAVIESQVREVKGQIVEGRKKLASLTDHWEGMVASSRDKKAELPRLKAEIDSLKKETLKHRAALQVAATLNEKYEARVAKLKRKHDLVEVFEDMENGALERLEKETEDFKKKFQAAKANRVARKQAAAKLALKLKSEREEVAARVLAEKREIESLRTRYQTVRVSFFFLFPISYLYCVPF